MTPDTFMECRCEGISPLGRASHMRTHCRLALMVGWPDQCWPWTAFLDEDGYGRMQPAGFQQAHRVAYTWAKGPIPEGMTLDHLCRNPSCINPDHLEPVTRAENTRRAYSAKTHCKNGHEFTESNTNRSAGYRRCIECARTASRLYQRRKRAEQRPSKGEPYAPTFIEEGAAA